MILEVWLKMGPEVIRTESLTNLCWIFSLSENYTFILLGLQDLEGCVI